MDIVSVIGNLFPWIIIASIFLGLTISIYLIHQKRKGTLQKSKFFSSFILLLLCCWLIIVIGITTLSRGSNYARMINLHLLSGYVNAWNKWSLSEFQLIIFNIIMFIPLGFLLPLYNQKFKNFSYVFLASFGVTLGIECIQFITNMGIFELDDIFHNTLGGIIGFLLIIGILECVEQKRLIFKSIMKSLAIPLVIGVLFVTILTAYSTKELGNMPILPAQKQSMKNRTVNLEIELSNESSTAALYQNKSANQIEHGKQIADALSTEYQLNQKSKIYIDGQNRLFSFEDSSGGRYELTYFLSDGTWTFTNLAYPEEIEISSTIEQNQKHIFENWMKQYNLLSSNAEYTLQNKQFFRWDINAPASIKDYQKSFESGVIMITPSYSNIPSSLFYSVIENTYIKNVEIISAQKAYEQILDGNFDIYLGLQKDDILTIKSVDLSYIYDTKGFYQPVYNFKVQLNDEEYLIDIKIPAIKNF